MPDFNINIKKTDPNAVIPVQGTPGAAGFDLCACIAAPVTIYPGETVLIPTGYGDSIGRGGADFRPVRHGLQARPGAQQ